MTAAVPGPPQGLAAVAPAVALAGAEAALQALGDLDTRPVDEHVELFDGLHRALQDALAALDEA